MQFDITNDDLKPWETPDPESIPILLLICVQCYTGEHRAHE